MDVEEVFCHNDMSAAIWTATATNEGEFMGIEPTGNKVTIRGITISRHDGERAVETWMQYDATKLMQTLDVLPEAIPADDD